MKTFEGNFYYQYKEDIVRAAGKGFKIFCICINWTSVFPTGLEERANEEALSFYDRVFDEFAGYGIEPLVTISKYETPCGLAKTYNGWKSREVIDHFLRFVSVVFARYQKTVRYWMIFNDIYSGIMPVNAVLSRESIRGHECHVDKTPDESQICFQMLHHQFIAVARAVKLAHDRYPDFKIGNMYISDTEYPHSCDPAHADDLRQQMSFINRLCSDVSSLGFYPSYMERWFEKNGIKIEKQADDAETLLNGRIDFHTLNDYMKACRNPGDAATDETAGDSDSSGSNAYLQGSESGRHTDPERLRDILNEIWERYQIPIMVVGNSPEFLNNLSDSVGNPGSRNKDTIYWYKKTFRKNGRGLA